MKKSFIKTFVALTTSLFVVFSVMGFACSCGGSDASREEDKRGVIDDTTIDTNESSWTKQKGEWVFDDGLIIQNKNGMDNRVVYNSDVDQNSVKADYEVKFNSQKKASKNKAVFEFRAGTDYSQASRTRIVLDIVEKTVALDLPQATYNISRTQKVRIEKNEWIKVSIILNGSDIVVSVNGSLCLASSDIPYKAGGLKIALMTDNAGVVFRNISVLDNSAKGEDLTEILAESNIVKKGYEAYASKTFEYPYFGLGKTTVYASPNGFTYKKAPKNPLVISDNYTFDPMMVHDYWWDGTTKIVPFTFDGGYNVNRQFVSGEITSGGAYEQTVNIADGSLKTALNLNVDGSYINTERECFVTLTGELAYKITNNTDKDFVFKVFGYKGKQIGAQAFTDGLLFSYMSHDTDGNVKYLYLAVTVDAESSVVYNADDFSVSVGATNKPIYIYLSPSSQLNPEENMFAGEAATQRALDAKSSGYNSLKTQADAWWEEMWGSSSISIPDKGLAIWYARSTFYCAVSMGLTRVPPGCYSSNPEGFYGSVCFEFDIMYPQLAMLSSNRSDLSGTTAEWINSIKDKASQLAKSGKDRDGNTYYGLDDAYMFAWLMAYDGSPVNASNSTLYKGWRNSYPMSNVAQAMILQALYTGEGLNEALDLLVKQGRAHLSKFTVEMNGGLVHNGVWGPTEDDPNAIHPGDFLQSVAAVWTIKTALEYGVAPVEWENLLNRLVLSPELTDGNGYRYGTVYARALGQYSLINSALATAGSDPSQAGGPQVSPFYWLNIYDFNDYTLMPTLINIVEGDNLTYNFNRGWAASLAAKIGNGNLAYDLVCTLLDAGCVYDDSYFCENINDEEDFERAPELGAHGSLIDAVNNMLIDGINTDYIKIFPAIPDEWAKIGVSFKNLAATGQVLVSADYSDAKTVVTIKNQGSLPVTKDVYVRVKAGSTKSSVGGDVYDNVGNFAKITLTLNAGEEMTFEVVGVSDARPSAFSILMPTTTEGTVKGIREENTVFGWSQSTGAEEYKLIISENADLSNPVFDKSVGTKTLTYVYNQTLVSLNANTTYYYTVIAINEKGETTVDGGIHSFKTRVTDINTFGYKWSIVGDVYEDDGKIIVNASTSANDTNNIALVQPEASNFTVDVVISNFKPNELHQQVGIIFYEHDTSYVKFNRSYTNDVLKGIPTGNYFEFKGNSASVVNIHVADGVPSDRIYLKAILNGSTLTAYYSADGALWSEVGVSTDVDFIKMKVGVYASTWLNSSATATIESFQITYSGDQPETDKAVVWNKQFTKNGNININGDTVTIAGGATDTENYLSASIPGIKQGVAVKVNFAPASINHQAGILFFDGNAYFKFIRTNDGGDCVKIEAGATDGSEELITIDGESKVLLSQTGPVWLKYSRDGAKINFYYGFDGETFYQIGGDHILNGTIFNAENISIALFTSKWGGGDIDGYFLDFVEETENIRVAITVPIAYASETVVTGRQGNKELVFTRSGTEFYAEAVRYGEPVSVKAERTGSATYEALITNTSTNVNKSFAMAGTTFTADNWTYEQGFTPVISSDKIEMTQTALPNANEWGASIAKTINGKHWQIQMRVTKISSFDTVNSKMENIEQRLGFMLGDVTNKYKATYLKLVNNFNKVNGHFGLWTAAPENGGTITVVGSDNIDGSYVGGLTPDKDFYIRIVRNGNVINLFGSEDGSTWVQVGGDHTLNEDYDSLMLYISTANYNCENNFTAKYSEYQEYHFE